MARNDLHFRLRIPEDLKAQVQAQADANKRSMTAEIIARLEHSFEHGHLLDFSRGNPTVGDVDQILHMLFIVRQAVAKLEGVEPDDLANILAKAQTTGPITAVREGQKVLMMQERAAQSDVDPSLPPSQGPVDAPMVRVGRRMKAENRSAPRRKRALDLGDDKEAK